MSSDSSMRYIDTEKASVKMTGGVPFKVGENSDSESELDSEEDENKVHFVDGINRSEKRLTPKVKSHEFHSVEQSISSSKSNGVSIEHNNSKLTNENDIVGHSGECQHHNDNVISDELKERASPSRNISNEVNFSSMIKEKELISSCSTDGSTFSKDNQHYIEPSSPIQHSNTELTNSTQKRKLSTNTDIIFNDRVPQDIPSHMLINSDEEHRPFINTRFNPFNQIPMLEEDHFSCQSQSNSYGSSSPRSSHRNADGVSHPEAYKSDVSFAELGLAEDHFSHPQGHFGLSGVEELELAIDNCKDMIGEAEQGSEKQKNLVMKLVQLRIKLQEIKDGPDPVSDDVKIILSHKMIPKSSRTSKYYCERCNGVIWGMLQQWYRCSECGYRCHEKCLQQILRTCAKMKVMENQPLIMEICPKDPSDLASQTYRCAECRSAISFKPGQSEPRLCDYSGRYYCEYCHWNDSVIIPARVLHNWDFNPRKVSRSSKQFLKLMQQKAAIRIQDINPMLFVYVDQLNELKKLREEMMVMKKYITSCPSAMAAKLLLLLEKRQHYVESSDRYSMQDLLDSEDETLLPELVNIHSTWAQHIKVDCELCQGRGFCCELCNENDILFPFDNIAVVCAKCSNVLHRHCFAKKSLCPRCERRGKKNYSH